MKRNLSGLRSAFEVLKRSRIVRLCGTLSGIGDGHAGMKQRFIRLIPQRLARIECLPPGPPGGWQAINMVQPR
jgi:hypothetical protein